VAPLSGSTKRVARVRSNDGHGTCIPPRPVAPNDTVGYYLVAPFTRCLEAELTPLRRLMAEEHERRSLNIGLNPTFPTEQQCYDCTYV
jgi:hypothetical protein